MPRFTKILVPTDFSPAAAGALALATELAADLGASIVLLHVIPLSAYPLETAAEIRSFPERRDEVTAYCTDQLAQLAGGIQRVDVECEVVEGSPAEAILHAATSAGADLIAMGTHGYTGLKHVLLGSVAERVVRLSTCPVLTVRTAVAGPSPA